MANLRKLLCQSEYGFNIALMRDQRVIEQFTCMLNYGHWRICAPIEAEIRTRETAAQSQAATAPPPLPQPVASAPRRTPVAPDRVAKASPENTTFPSSHDGLAQALALREAAESGKAFCEECNKLRPQKNLSAQRG